MLTALLSEVFSNGGSEMAKGYWVAAYRAIHDPGKLTAYGALATAVVRAAGGRFLARGGGGVAVEDGLEERTGVVEFPWFGEALAALQSDAYFEAVAVLGEGAPRDARARPARHAP